MKLLFKLPSRERKDKLFAAIDNIIEMCVTEDYHILCSCDISDSVMTDKAVRDRLNEYGKVTVIYGNSKTKVEAINADIWTQDAWDVLIVTADDMVIQQKGFDSFIEEDMRNNFPDTDGVLHYLDGSPARDKLITWPVIGRKYYDRFNYVYHPEYASVYCDNEQTEVSKRLGKYKFMNRQLVDHRHFIWGKSQIDDLYRRNEEPIQYKKDADTYYRRLANNFDL